MLKLFPVSKNKGLKARFLRDRLTKPKGIISILLTIAFSVTNITGNDVAWAQSASAGNLIEVKDIVSKGMIPSDLGILRDYQLNDRSNKNPFVVHIQDAHSNVDAQKNIFELLSWINQNNDIVIGLEGAVDEIHPEYLEFFPEFPEANQAVVDSLLNKGELNGTELFAWEQYKKNTSQKYQIVAAEDVELYATNLQSFRELSFQQDELSLLVQKHRKNLEIAKSRIFNSELNDFLKERDRRKNGNYSTETSSPQLTAYINYLSGTVSSELGVHLDNAFEQLRFPNMVRLLVLSEIEKNLSLRQALSEKTEAIKMMREKLKGQDAREALLELEKLDRGMAAREIIEKIWSAAAVEGIDLNQFAQYKTYLGSLVLNAEIDAEGLFSEMSLLEHWLLEHWSPSADEKKLVSILEDFELMEKLLKLRWTTDDLEKFEARKEQVKASFLGNEIEGLATKLGFQSHVEKNKLSARDLNLLSNASAQAVEFYRVAIARDEALLEKTLASANKNSVAVIVSGGYHTDGLVSRMNQKEISYAVIQPVIRKNDGGALYHKALKDENADVSNYFNKNVLNKQEALYFKSLMEVAAPELWESYQVPHNELGAKVSHVINTHEVLSQKMQASAKQLDATSSVEFKASQSENEVLGVGNNAVALTPVTTKQKSFANAYRPVGRMIVADDDDDDVLPTVASGVTVFKPTGVTVSSSPNRVAAVYNAPQVSLRNELRTLTAEQEALLEEAARVYELEPYNVQYLRQMWVQRLNPETKQLSLTLPDSAEPGNFILAAQLSEEDREKLLGAFEYSRLRQDESLPAYAAKAQVNLYALDGGLGESLGREAFKANLVERGLLAEEDVERDADGKIKLGAKGTDLGFVVDINDAEVFVSIAEAKLNQLIVLKEAGKFSGFSLTPLVNKDSLPSYLNLFEKPYLVHRLEGVEKPRTYRQVLAEYNIEIREPHLQQNLPAFDVETGNVAVTLDAVNAPGGHGQFGSFFFSFPETWQKIERPQILLFQNGDNVNASRVDEYVVGKMIRDKVGIMKLTTVATRIDVKGGKDGVYIVEVAVGDKTVKFNVPQQWEKADAEAVGQYAAFVLAGQLEGAELFGQESVGNQAFNTNIIAVNEDLLFPLLADLKEYLGTDKYYSAISATRIDKPSKVSKVDGREYQPVDSAIGTVIHNMNEFVMTTQDDQIKEILKRHGVQPDQEGVYRILSFVNVPRSQFFTPDKKPSDAWMQQNSDYFTFDTETFTLEENALVEGQELTPPELDFKGQFFSELQNLIDALGSSKIRELGGLELDGKVLLADSQLIGEVKIISEAEELVDLRSDEFREALENASIYQDGNLVFKNVSVLIDANRNIAIEEYNPFAKSELRSVVEDERQYFDVANGVKPGDIRQLRSSLEAQSRLFEGVIVSEPNTNTISVRFPEKEGVASAVEIARREEGDRLQISLSEIKGVERRDLNLHLSFKDSILRAASQDRALTHLNRDHTSSYLDVDLQDLQSIRITEGADGLPQIEVLFDVGPSRLPLPLEPRTVEAFRANGFTLNAFVVNSVARSELRSKIAKNERSQSIARNLTIGLILFATVSSAIYMGTRKGFDPNRDIPVLEVEIREDLAEILFAELISETPEVRELAKRKLETMSTFMQDEIVRRLAVANTSAYYAVLSDEAGVRADGVSQSDIAELKKVEESTRRALDLLVLSEPSQFQRLKNLKDRPGVGEVYALYVGFFESENPVRVLDMALIEAENVSQKIAAIRGLAHVKGETDIVGAIAIVERLLGEESVTVENLSDVYGTPQTTPSFIVLTEVDRVLREKLKVTKQSKTVSTPENRNELRSTEEIGLSQNAFDSIANELIIAIARAGVDLSLEHLDSNKDVFKLNFEETGDVIQLERTPNGHSLSITLIRSNATSDVISLNLVSRDVTGLNSSFGVFSNGRPNHSLSAANLDIHLEDLEKIDLAIASGKPFLRVRLTAKLTRDLNVDIAPLLIASRNELRRTLTDTVATNEAIERIRDLAQQINLQSGFSLPKASLTSAEVSQGIYAKVSSIASSNQVSEEVALAALIAAILDLKDENPAKLDATIDLVNVELGSELGSIFSSLVADFSVAPTFTTTVEELQNEEVQLATAFLLRANRNNQIHFVVSGEDTEAIHDEVHASIAEILQGLGISTKSLANRLKMTTAPKTARQLSRLLTTSVNDAKKISNSTGSVISDDVKLLKGLPVMPQVSYADRSTLKLATAIVLTPAMSGDSVDQRVINMITHFESKGFILSTLGQQISTFLKGLRKLATSA